MASYDSNDISNHQQIDRVLNSMLTIILKLRIGGLLSGKSQLTDKSNLMNSQ